LLTFTITQRYVPYGVGASSSSLFQLTVNGEQAAAGPWWARPPGQLALRQAHQPANLAAPLQAGDLDKLFGKPSLAL
jgi:hypothetical protein